MGAFHQRSVNGIACAFHQKTQAASAVSPVSLGSAEAMDRTSGHAYTIVRTT